MSAATSVPPPMAALHVGLRWAGLILALAAGLVALAFAAAAAAVIGLAAAAAALVLHFWPRPKPDGPVILDAHPTPNGWEVETRRS